MTHDQHAGARGATRRSPLQRGLPKDDAGLEPRPTRPAQVDVLVVTALHEEHEAVRKVGSAHAEQTEWLRHDAGGFPPYQTIEVFISGGSTISVALARPTRMGSRSTAPMLTALAQRLEPRCLAMCGVCAGNPDVLALGDVVVAELVYEFDEGKLTTAGFLGDHRQFPMDEHWVRQAQEFSQYDLDSYGSVTLEEAKLWLLEQLLIGNEPRNHPARARYFPDRTWPIWPLDVQAEGLIMRSGQGWALTEKGRCTIERRLYDDVDGPDRLPFAVKVAPIGSGSSVVSDHATWTRLRNMGVRTIAALDTEAATVATVAHQQRTPHWLVVKGVMDHADSNKDDRYKTFAARASAEVLFALLCRLLARPSTGPAARRVPAKS